MNHAAGNVIPLSDKCPFWLFRWHLTRPRLSTFTTDPTVAPPVGTLKYMVSAGYQPSGRVKMIVSAVAVPDLTRPFSRTQPSDCIQNPAVSYVFVPSLP